MLRYTMVVNALSPQIDTPFCFGVLIKENKDRHAVLLKSFWLTHSFPHPAPGENDRALSGGLSGRCGCLNKIFTGVHLHSSPSN